MSLIQDGGSAPGLVVSHLHLGMQPENKQPELGRQDVTLGARHCGKWDKWDSAVP